MSEKNKINQYIPTTRAGSCIPAGILLQILEQGQRKRNAEIHAWVTTAERIFWCVMVAFLVFALTRTR
jgi:hypothetical protein